MMIREEIRKDNSRIVRSALPIQDKEIVLRYLKSFSPSSAAGYTMIDEITGEDTGEYLLGYDDGVYAWDSRDIYHFEKYDIALRSDFISHVARKHKVA